MLEHKRLISSDFHAFDCGFAVICEWHKPNQDLPRACGFLTWSIASQYSVLSPRSAQRSSTMLDRSLISLARSLCLHRFSRWQRGIQWKSSSNIVAENSYPVFGWMEPRLWLSRSCRGYRKACEGVSHRLKCPGLASGALIPLSWPSLIGASVFMAFSPPCSCLAIFTKWITQDTCHAMGGKPFKKLKPSSSLCTNHAIYSFVMA